jgi:glutathione S-transferase
VHVKRYAATPEAQVNKPFYDKSIASIAGLHAILNGQAPDEVKQGFFSKSTTHWDNIKAFTLETLPAAISEGPFIAGARPGVDDFHVAAWLARIAFLLGAQKSEEGVAALEKTFGTLPEKVKAFWAAWIARDSWVKAYPDNQLR